MTARVPLTEAERSRIIQRDGFRCRYCNRVGGVEIGPGDVPWHIDHKVPVANDGGNEPGNLALSCKRCNVTKHTRDYDDFIAFARVAYWVDDSEGLPPAVLVRLAELWSETMSWDTLDGETVTADLSVETADAITTTEVVVRHRDVMGMDAGVRALVLNRHYGARRNGGDAAAELLAMTLNHLPNLLALVAGAKEVIGGGVPTDQDQHAAQSREHLEETHMTTSHNRPNAAGSVGAR